AAVRSPCDNERLPPRSLPSDEARCQCCNGSRHDRMELRTFSRTPRWRRPSRDFAKARYLDSCALARAAATFPPLGGDERSLRPHRLVATTPLRCCSPCPGRREKFGERFENGPLLRPVDLSERAPCRDCCGPCFG